jgi:hypothetical protein
MKILDILDILADKLLATPIMEMARDRAFAIQTVANKQYVLNAHIIKYLYFNDSAQNHWLKEISGFITEINRIYLKPKSTRLSKKVYFDKLFEDDYGHGTNILEDIIDDMVSNDYKNSSTSGLSIQQVWWGMKQFYMWLCPLLETDNYRQLLKQNPNLLKQKLDQIRLQTHQV